MTKLTAYRDRYPKPGQVAVLCEGDVVGYESSILHRWADRVVGTDPLVDVWPCGTGESLFGVSDAIGRCRSLLVIEDRDFRTVEKATKDSARSQRSREERDIRVLAWRSWRRNEIENYLLDDAVLLPVLTQWFNCPERDIVDVVNRVVQTLAVFQAAEHALYRVRRKWGQSDPTSMLRNGLQHKPHWDEVEKGPVPPNVTGVRDRLAENIGQWREKRVIPGDGNLEEPFRGDLLLQEFDQKYEQWRTEAHDTPVWRIDWAGKEVLQYLRLCLTARYGWPNAATGTRDFLCWDGLNKPRRSAEYRQCTAQDRDVEFAMQKDLVDAFTTHLAATSHGDLHDEWSEMESSLRGWSR
jgi:hypothetical protein